jgi:hypothetical protein
LTHTDTAKPIKPTRPFSQINPSNMNFISSSFLH